MPTMIINDHYVYCVYMNVVGVKDDERHIDDHDYDHVDDHDYDHVDDHDYDHVDDHDYDYVDDHDYDYVDDHDYDYVDDHDANYPGGGHPHKLHLLLPLPRLGQPGRAQHHLLHQHRNLHHDHGFVIVFSLSSIMTAIIMITTNHPCDHSQVLAGSGDATTTLWDVESGTVLQTFHGHVSGGRVTIINITITVVITIS